MIVAEKAIDIVKGIGVIGLTIASSILIGSKMEEVELFEIKIA